MLGIYFSGTGNSRYAAELFCREYDEITLLGKCIVEQCGIEKYL